MSQLLPPLKTEEREALRASIAQDGIREPVKLDRTGRVIDGHHRREIADELGIPCPTDTLDVDEATADRLRLALNLARRHLTPLERAEILASLAAPILEEEQARAGERIQDHGGTAPGTPRDTMAQGVRARDAAATRLSSGEAGVPLKVSGRTLDRAVATAALPEPAKDRIRNGHSSVTQELHRHRRDADVSRVEEANAGLMSDPDTAAALNAAHLRSNFWKAASSWSGYLGQLDPERVAAVQGAEFHGDALQWIRDVRRWLDALEAGLQRPVRLVKGEG